VNSTPFRASKPWLLKAAAVLAASLLTGLAAQALDKAPLRDKWTAQEVATLASMRLKEAGQRPADPSNAFEQRTEAAMLGRAPFNDTRFSVRTDA
jgi:cytochrome c peroxidase